MTAVVLVARLLLAGVFVVSAVAKLRDRPGTRTAVQDFGVPAALVGPVALALPVVELVCAGLLLAADPFATAGAVASLLLLAAFTVAIVVNLLQGRRPDCHCFGQLGGGAVSWRSVGRNAVLMALAAVSLVGSGSLRSVPAELADASPGRLAVGVMFALLTAAVVGLALALKALTARYGAVLLRLEALEIATGIAPPQPAPDFALPGLDGAVVTTEDVLAAGRPVMLAFLSPTCTLCSDLVPLLADWQSDLQHPVEVVVVSTGSAADNEAKLQGAPLRVLLQESFEVADAYGVTGTPGAVLVSADGLLASPPAQGLGAVVALHDSAVRTVQGAHDHGPAVHQIEPRPVAVGDAFPDVTVATDDGAPTTLAALTPEPTVLLFWRTDCGFCAGILDDVRRLQDTTPLMLVSGTPTEVLRDSGLTVPVLREVDSALTVALRVPGTPAAVRVRDGVAESPVAVGGPEVLALLTGSGLVRHFA